MGKKIEIDLERAIEMYKDGATTTEIGKVLGCGYKTVIKNLTEAGVYVPKRRDVGKAKVSKAKVVSKPEKDIPCKDNTSVLYLKQNKICSKFWVFSH